MKSREGNKTFLIQYLRDVLHTHWECEWESKWIFTWKHPTIFLFAYEILFLSTTKQIVHLYCLLFLLCTIKSNVLCVCVSVRIVRSLSSYNMNHYSVSECKRDVWCEFVCYKYENLLVNCTVVFSYFSCNILL